MIECIQRLERLGIGYDDAAELRRISMALHRWHELECGDGNDCASWCIVRGRNTRRKMLKFFIYNDNGTPFIERHSHSSNEITYEAIPDRERGALRRLKRIMAAYPVLVPYVQTDPRGASLYVLNRVDVDGGKGVAGQPIDEIYNRGVAVYK